MFEFLASGSPRVVSSAIEEFARVQGHVTALVVPWESTASTLTMAVTAVKADGWAIAHTNLGTIALTEDGDATRVAVQIDEAGGADRETLAPVFARFARDLRQRLSHGPDR